MGLGRYLKFPFEDPDWAKKIIIGCVISIVPILNILALGYFMECIRFGARGIWVLPEWENWNEYVIQGLIGFLITVAYMLIPLIVFLLPGVGLLLSAVFFVIAGIIIPMAMANFAIKRDFIAALNLKEIFYQISKVINYYIMAYFVVLIVASLGIAICLGAPILAFIGSLLIFYSGLIYFNMIGQLYHAAMHG
jgi:hypothetical protein